MSTPQNPQQPLPEGYELKKKKKPWYQRLGCIVPLVLALILIIAVATTSGGDDSESASDTSSDSASADNAGEAPAAAEESGPAAIGETVSTKKADITASNLRPSSDVLGSYLCVDVNFVVTGEESINLNGMMDWKLTDPNGVTITQTVGGENDYDSVEVGPGGNKSGTVCFDAAGAPGEYTLTFEEGLSLSSEQAQWTATL